jgi:hypothetical protein
MNRARWQLHLYVCRASCIRQFVDLDTTPAIGMPKPGIVTGTVLGTDWCFRREEAPLSHFRACFGRPRLLIRHVIYHVGFEISNFFLLSLSSGWVFLHRGAAKISNFFFTSHLPNLLIPTCFWGSPQVRLLVLERQRRFTFASRMNLWPRTKRAEAGLVGRGRLSIGFGHPSDKATIAANSKR